jgi:hypothetical protein
MLFQSDIVLLSDPGPFWIFWIFSTFLSISFSFHDFTLANQIVVEKVKGGLAHGLSSITQNKSIKVKAKRVIRQGLI